MPAYQTAGDKLVDENLMRYGDDSGGAERFSATELTKIEEGDAIWIPPEAADSQDEIQQLGAFTNSDDEDDDDDGECHDRMNWGQPSSSDSEPSPSPREERQTAMLKAMNRQLKMLASRFLASAGISLPREDDGGESWLDIVTSLSWEAALLIKPDGKAGNEMDPGSYVKVKRVASGTRRQW
jgi:1-phosphatidylinositol-3-phosphate 5-kinase